MLYDKQIDVYRTTLIYFCKLELIENCKSSDDILSIDFSNSVTVLPYEEISIGSHARRLISDFREEDKIVFFESIKNFFRKICNQLKKNLSLSNKLLANLRGWYTENGLFLKYVVTEIECFTLFRTLVELNFEIIK